MSLSSDRTMQTMPEPPEEDFDTFRNPTSTSQQSNRSEGLTAPSTATTVRDKGSQQRQKNRAALKKENDELSAKLARGYNELQAFYTKCKVAQLDNAVEGDDKRSLLDGMIEVLEDSLNSDSRKFGAWFPDFMSAEEAQDKMKELEECKKKI